MRGTLVVERFASRALAGNPLGDPHVRDLPVYLPPSYRRRERRFPVCYVLTGYTGKGSMLLNVRPWGETIVEQYERLLRAGRTREMILVLPDCFTRYGGSQYLNSPATGRYEDYVVRELVPYIDGRYRTQPSRDHRGVDGKSSGGYGAMVLAMRNPDVFGGVASHSGDMYFEAGYKPFFWKAVPEIAKHGGVEKFLNAFDAAPKKSPEAVDALMLLIAMAQAYSANEDGTYDLPIDLQTGELRDAVWARWLDWDPVYMVERHAAALRQMKVIYIECGSKDQYYLQYGARILSQRLTALGIPHEHQEFDDNHTSVNYRYVESLRRLATALA